MNNTMGNNTCGNVKEEIKNEILLAMSPHIGGNTINILRQIINKTFVNVEITRTKMLPSTVDDVNSKILELFRMNKVPKISPKTSAYYLDTINRLICFTNKALIKITQMDIELFLDSLKSTNSAVSINNHRRNISSFYTWMRKSHLTLENPCESVEGYKEIHKPIDYMSPEDFEQLKLGCKHKRDRAMIEFLRCTAMRVGEITNVKVSDIDWRSGKLLIYGEKNRTYRPVCLDSVAIKYIMEYVYSRQIDLNSNEYLFTSIKGDGEQLHCEGIRHAVHSIAKRANVNRRIYPHLFRKTCASNIVKRGGSIHDAGEYLGHKDRSTAGQHYVYMGEEHTIEIFKKFVATV